MIRILFGDSDDGQNEEKTQAKDTSDDGQSEERTEAKDTRQGRLCRSGNWQDIAFLFLLHYTVCWNMCMTLPKG